MTGRVSLLALLTPLLVGAPAARATRDLGKAELVRGPERCGKADCYSLEVTCPEVLEAARATLRARVKASATHRGTIYLATGGGGRSLWGEAYGRPAKKALKRLRARGFRTVEVQWEDSWLDGSAEQREGQARLACRPATLARWIYDNLHTAAGDAPYCATGNSGGASQVSYMLSHYGLEEILSSVVPSGGPPMGRIDLGCLGPQDPELPNMIYSEGARDTIDRSFGYFRNDGPCNTRQSASALRRASIAAKKDREYVYEKTMVWFVFGSEDLGSAVGQGIVFHDRLVEAGSPLVGMSVAADTPHAVPSTRRGANAIRDVLLDTCVLNE